MKISSLRTELIKRENQDHCDKANHKLNNFLFVKQFNREFLKDDQ